MKCNWSEMHVAHMRKYSVYRISFIACLFIICIELLTNNILHAIIAKNSITLFGEKKPDDEKKAEEEDDDRFK